MHFDKKKFKAELALRGMSMKDLAKLLKINESTIYRKFNADGDFSREEISKIITIMGIENPFEIFFAN